jgi:hypothetical protein
MLPLVILLNIIFFCSGYFRGVTLATITDRRWSRMEDIFTIAVLAGLISFILWLVFYLRQNAFKGLLPISRFHLLKEFVIILVTILGLCSLIVAYEEGLFIKLRQVSKNINLEKEQTIVKLADHFLPFSPSEFAAKKTKQEYNRQGEIDSSTGVLRKGQVAGYSYLNFSYEYEDRDDSSRLYIKARRWLTEHRKDSIINIIDRYLRLCKKYGGHYRLNVMSHVNSIFATPEFSIGDNRIESYEPETGFAPYIDRYNVTQGLYKVEYAREGLDKGILIALFYFTLCAGILLFSFRVVPIAIWFRGIVVAIIFLILIAIAGITSSTGIVPTTMAIVIFVFGLYVFSHNVTTKTYKLTSGVCYLLSLWSLPAITMVVHELLRIICRYNFDYSEQEIALHHNRAYRFYSWLGDHSKDWVVAGLIFALLMMFFVMIPLIKKWRANPEE